MSEPLVGREDDLDDHDNQMREVYAGPPAVTGE
jgi:hypothetical protein